MKYMVGTINVGIDQLLPIINVGWVASKFSLGVKGLKSRGRVALIR